jgi:hypothetical protein
VKIKGKRGIERVNEVKREGTGKRGSAGNKEKEMNKL